MKGWHTQTLDDNVVPEQFLALATRRRHETEKRVLEHVRAKDVDFGPGNHSVAEPRGGP